MTMVDGQYVLAAGKTATITFTFNNPRGDGVPVMGKWNLSYDPSVIKVSVGGDESLPNQGHLISGMSSSQTITLSVTGVSGGSTGIYASWNVWSDPEASPAYQFGIGSSQSLGLSVVGAHIDAEAKVIAVHENGANDLVPVDLEVFGITPTAIGQVIGVLTATGGTINNGSAASFNGTGAIVLPSGANVTLTLTGSNTSHNALSPILSNPTGGTLSVVKSGTGKWTFNQTGNKTYSGDTHVIARTLETLAGNAFSANSNMVLDSGVTLELHDNSATINALVGAGSVVNSFVAHTDTLTVGAAGGSGTFSGTISSGPTLNFVNNDSGTQTLSGVNAYNGTTTISSGTLALADNGQISTISHIINNATFLIADDVASHTVGAITGTGTTQLNDGANLTVTSIVQSTLIMGNGSTLNIQAIPGGLPASSGNFQSVPEPSALALLGIGAFSLLACAWRWQRRNQLLNNG